MNKKEWSNVLRLLRDYSTQLGRRRTLAAMTAQAVLEGITPYINLILMGWLLDRVYAGSSLQELALYTLLALGAACVMSALAGLCTSEFNRKLEYMYEQQSRLTSAKCLDFDYEYLEDKQVHEMLQSIRNAGTGFGLLGHIMSNLNKLIRTVISLVAGIVVVIPLFVNGVTEGGGFFSSWLASILLFVLVGLLVYLNYKTDIHFGERIKTFRENRAGNENILQYYMGILGSYDRQKDLRIYHQQELIRRKTDEAMAGVDKELNKEAACSCWEEWIKQTVTALTSLLIYSFAGVRAYLGLITVGGVVTYASSIVQMSSAMAEMMRNMAWLKVNAQYCKDYVGFAKLGQQKYQGTIPVEKRSDHKFSVEFDHVSFCYPGTEEYVIRDLNLQFTIGERMAIVGKNGSGKTTFIKLLCRLYDVTEGCIKVNGIDIRKYDYEEYCRLFSVVFQDFKIFSFALGENMAGSGEVEEERAVDALERAGMGEVFRKLPQGLKTYVGKDFNENGVTFSGGERQKMAIARAIYKDAPFVIMDEPTAALDPQSECEVYAGFDKMVGRKTAIYISHRLASCRFCQDILVFDRGQVVQRGGHDELADQPGLYRELWEAQAQYYR